MTTMGVDQEKLSVLRKRVRGLLERSELTHEDALRLSRRSAKIIYNAFLAAEQRNRISKDIQRDTFYTNTRTAPERYLLTQLAGVRLRGKTRPWAANYREWHARAARTRLIWRGRGANRRITGGRTQEQGKLVGMSLAMMYHWGTRKLPRNRFATEAKQVGRIEVYRQLEQDLKDLFFAPLGE